MKRTLAVLLLCGAALCAGSPAEAAGRGRSNLPIELKANELQSDSNSRTATFTGKVSARQGDVTIYSDKLVIHYAERTKDVDRVEATGNVIIVQGDRRGQAAHAVYDNSRGTIVLDGNPKVFQGESTITGRVITYYLDEQKSTVSGGAKPTERVEAVIYPNARGKDAGR